MRRTEVGIRVGKLNNGKGGGDRVVGLIWRLCNMPFESGVVPKS